MSFLEIIFPYQHECWNGFFFFIRNELLDIIIALLERTDQSWDFFHLSLFLSSEINGIIFGSKNKKNKNLILIEKIMAGNSSERIT